MIINNFFILVCLSLVTSSLLVTKKYERREKTNILNKPLLKKSYGKTNKHIS